MSDLSTKPKPSFAPVYAAALYPEFAEKFRDHGWALAVHGSLQRDFDLIAVPWVESPTGHEAVIDELKTIWAIDPIIGPKSRLHGRTVYTLCFGFGSCFVDLSFMPVVKVSE